MGRVLFHIYGPFAVYSYGALIALGAFLFLLFIQRDQRFAKLQLDASFTNIFLLGIGAALFGGRALAVWQTPDMFGHWTEWFMLWEPGFSILGAVIGVMTFVPLYLMSQRVPVLPFFDLVATYAGIMQSFGRLGCFFAGCCFGCPTTLPWAVEYTDPDSIAPLYVYMHPTQLYSATALLLIFAFMYFIGRTLLRVPGQQLSVYLMLVSLQRGMVDIVRGDTEFVPSLLALTVQQLVALGIFAAALVLFIGVTFFGTRTET